VKPASDLHDCLPLIKIRVLRQRNLRLRYPHRPAPIFSICCVEAWSSKARRRRLRRHRCSLRSRSPKATAVLRNSSSHRAVLIVKLTLLGYPRRCGHFAAGIAVRGGPICSRQIVARAHHRLISNAGKGICAIEALTREGYSHLARPHCYGHHASQVRA
jgi:hypothetical protein